MKSIKWMWKVDHPVNRADVAIIEAIQNEKGSWTGGPVSCSRNQIQRLMTEGHVTADNVVIKANLKIKLSSVVQIEFPEPKSLGLRPEDIPIDILYQDEHLLVVNKPPGLTVHPSSTQTEGTLVHALLHHIKDLSTIGGVLRPGIVHRLDKNTSGALVVSKTDRAHRELAEIFAAHAIERTYWALCYGTSKEIGTQKPTRIESLIGRNPKDRKKMTTLKTGGRKAISLIRKIDDFFGGPKKSHFASKLEVTLETGRTHQVRVHLTGIGLSILGDPVYGTPTEKQPKWLALPLDVRKAMEDLPGQALHARILGFKHPVSGKMLRFEAEPPPGFRNLLESLEKYRKI